MIVRNREIIMRLFLNCGERKLKSILTCIKKILKYGISYSSKYE